jgi:hypothetical protein
MSEKTYLVALTGRLVEGMDTARAAVNLAELFKVPESRAAALLTGRPVVLKNGLDQTTARRYQAALRDAGLLAQVMAAAGAAQDGAGAVADAAVAQAVNPAPVTELSLAPVGADLSDRMQVPPLQVDLSGMTLAEPGVTLSEPRDVAEPDIDISGLEAPPPEPGERSG